MNFKRPNQPTVKRIKTGKIERRLSLAKAGLFAGARFAGHSFANALFGEATNRESRKREILSEQAHYFTSELGKLKGSVVKIGQIMALWGEHFLPPEVTKALHELEDNTATVDWPTIQALLMQQLGPTSLSELRIDRTPIGSASLGQVHRATCLKSGEEICLKVQYPGVADAIDSDLDAIEQLLKLSRLIPITTEFKLWFSEVRSMLKREVDYRLELESTKRFRAYLANDPRFIVPKVYEQYSTERVLATSYEPGIGIGSSDCIALSQERRNHIGSACLDLCWKEVFEWGEMQTDPNFGNYFVRLDHQGLDRIVLLDFGAVRQFPKHILEPGKAIVEGAYYHNFDKIKTALIHLGFVPEGTPQAVFQQFSELCSLAIEPFVKPSTKDSSNTIAEFPDYYDVDTNTYDWEKSNLANRTLSLASKSAISRHFAIPPKEFMFLSRKIIGAYTLMSVLKAKINGEEILMPYLKKRALQTQTSKQSPQ